MVGTGLGAAKGILIKNAESLERAHKIQTVILDKTGTITEGKPSVTDVVQLNDCDETTLLQRTASVEKRSEHPLAQAVVEYVQRKDISLVDIETFQSHTGLGVTGVVDGDAVAIGNLAMMKEYAVQTVEAETVAARMSAEGKTSIFIAINGVLSGVIGLADRIKPSSKDAIVLMKEMGMNVV
ncbi:MAG TPA: cation-transporting ATPase PacS, partial [Sphaerochaeta sp.]|nr:cation-transporting ATPase PacS [Sphaerochaeta sp.]